MAETHFTPLPVHNHIAVSNVDYDPQEWGPAPQRYGVEAGKIAVELALYRQKSLDYMTSFAEQAPLPDDQAEYATELFAALNLPMKPYIIFDNARSRHNTEILQNVHHGPWNPKHYGLYVGKLGVCMVDNLFTPNTLKTLIHEETHAGVIHTTAYEANEDGISKPPVVASLGSSKVDTRNHGPHYPKGTFHVGEWLHESFATLMGEAGANVYNYLDHKKHGVEIQLARGEDKYYDDTVKGRDTTEGMDGAKALELLIAKDHSFFDVLLEAQQSPRGMIKYTKAINTIHPGLHRYLRDAPVQGRAAEKNYAAILKQIETFVGFKYDGRHAKSLAWNHKNGTVERLILKKIEAYRASRAAPESQEITSQSVAVSSLRRPAGTRRNSRKVAGKITR